MRWRSSPRWIGPASPTSPTRAGGASLKSSSSSEMSSSATMAYRVLTDGLARPRSIWRSGSARRRAGRRARAGSGRARGGGRAAAPRSRGSPAAGAAGVGLVVARHVIIQPPSTRRSIAVDGRGSRGGSGPHRRRRPCWSAAGSGCGPGRGRGLAGPERAVADDARVDGVDPDRRQLGGQGASEADDAAVDGRDGGGARDRADPWPARRTGRWRCSSPRRSQQGVRPPRCSPPA